MTPWVIVSFALVGVVFAIGAAIALAAGSTLSAVIIAAVGALVVIGIAFKTAKRGESERLGSGD